MGAYRVVFKWPAKDISDRKGFTQETGFWGKTRFLKTPYRRPTPSPANNPNLIARQKPGFCEKPGFLNLCGSDRFSASNEKCRLAADVEADVADELLVGETD